MRVEKVKFEKVTFCVS